MQRDAGLGVDDADLEARHGAAEHGEAPAALDSGIDRGGVALGLEDATVDAVGDHAPHRLGEGAGDRHLGHAEGGEHRTGPQPVPEPGLDERLHLVGIDRLGAVQRDAQAGEVELVGAVEGAGGEDVAEVRTRGGGAAVGRQPLHPARRPGGEVLRGAEHQRRPGRHGQGQQPDQPHVVVQRQPRHQHVVVGIELGRLGDGVEVGPQDVIGEHHALGVAGRPAGELQDHEPVGVLVGARPRRGIAAGEVGERDHRGVPGLGDHEGGQLGVDDAHAGVGVADALAGLGHELVDRREPHRQRKDHDGGAGQPRRLDGGHQLAGGG